MEGLTFRPARAAELDRIADIINDPPAHGSVVIAGSVEKAVRAGRVLARRGISLQLEHATVAEIDGEVVGVMDASANRTDPEIGPALILRLLETKTDPDYERWSASPGRVLMVKHL